MFPDGASSKSGFEATITGMRSLRGGSETLKRLNARSLLLQEQVVPGLREATVLPELAVPQQLVVNTEVVVCFQLHP